MRTLNLGLKKAIGMPFTYKQKLQEFLAELKSAPIVVANLTSEQQTQLGKYVDNFVLCTPAMGFSSKLYAYQSLELATNGLLSVSSGVSDEKKAQLSLALLSVLKYVGIEGEFDYHFQVETFKAAEILSSITGEVVEGTTPITLGGVVKFVVFDGGSGYSDSVEGDTGVGIASAFESSEDDGSVVGTVDIDLVSGSVVEKEYTTTTAGSGFYVGQIILLVDDGGGTLTYDSVALAEVTEVA